MKKYVIEYKMNIIVMSLLIIQISIACKDTKDRNNYENNNSNSEISEGKGNDLISDFNDEIKDSGKSDSPQPIEKNKITNNRNEDIEINKKLKRPKSKENDNHELDNVIDSFKTQINSLKKSQNEEFKKNKNLSDNINNQIEDNTYTFLNPDETEIDPDKISIIFSHGYASNGKSMEFWKENLQKYSNNIQVPCREAESHLKINEQAVLIEKNIDKAIKTPEINKLILGGHSVGGNVSIQAMRNTLESDSELVDYILQNNIEIFIVTVGSPLKGAGIINKLPLDLLAKIGFDKRINIVSELGNTEEVTNQTKSNLEFIYNKLGDNVKIVTISGESDFLLNVTPAISLLGNNLESLLSSFMGGGGMPKIDMNSEEGLNNIMNKVVPNLDVKKSESIEKIVRGLGPNDGFIEVESQNATDIIPEGMKFTDKPYLIKPLSHINFMNKMDSISSMMMGMKSSELNEYENNQLNSKRVIEILKHLVAI